MIDNLPDPLVPAEVDLSDFPFMPVDVRRLLTSDTWLKATANKSIGFSSINLWFESWHQKPASSLPFNDAVLARLAMCTMDEWLLIKTDVLGGWVHCNDGRLYHPVVAEKALESYIEKLMQRYKGGCGNAKHWGTEFDPAPVLIAIQKTKDMLQKLNPYSRALKKKLPAHSTGIKEADKSKISKEISINDSTGIPMGIPTGIAAGIPQQSQETGTGTRTGTRINKTSCEEPSLSLDSSLQPNPSSSEGNFLQMQMPLAIIKPVVAYRLIESGAIETYYEVTEDFVKIMAESYPGVDLNKEFLSMQAWCHSNPKLRKTKQGMKRFINEWLRKSQDRAEYRLGGQVKQRGGQITQGKWSGFEQKNYEKGVKDDFSF